MSTNPAERELLEREALEAFRQYRQHHSPPNYFVEGRFTGPDPSVDLLSAQLAASSIQDPNVQAQSVNNCYLCTIAAVAGIRVEDAQLTTGYRHTGPAQPDVIAELAGRLGILNGRYVQLEAASQAEQVIKQHPEVPSWGLAYTQSGEGHMINAKLHEGGLVLRDHQALAEIDLASINAAANLFLFPFNKGWA